jgi:hypothetical protein
MPSQHHHACTFTYTLLSLLTIYIGLPQELQIEIDDLESTYPDLMKATVSSSSRDGIIYGAGIAANALDEGAEGAPDEPSSDSSSESSSGGQETSNSMTDSLHNTPVPDREGPDADEADGDSGHHIENATESDPGSAPIDGDDDDNEDTVDRAELIEQTKVSG